MLNRMTDWEMDGGGGGVVTVVYNGCAKRLRLWRSGGLASLGHSFCRVNNNGSYGDKQSLDETLFTCLCVSPFLERQPRRNGSLRAGGNGFVLHGSIQCKAAMPQK